MKRVKEDKFLIFAQREAIINLFVKTSVSLLKVLFSTKLKAVTFFEHPSRNTGHWQAILEFDCLRQMTTINENWY